MAEVSGRVGVPVQPGNLRPVSGRCVSHSGPMKWTSPRPGEYTVSKQSSLWRAAYMDMASRRRSGRKGGGESEGDRVNARSDSRAQTSNDSRSRAVICLSPSSPTVSLFPGWVGSWDSRTVTKLVPTMSAGRKLLDQVERLGQRKCQSRAKIGPGGLHIASRS